MPDLTLLAKPRLLVACECSERVTMAFRAKGIDAWSCDIKQSEVEGYPYHIQDDVLKHLAGLPCCPLCGEPYFVQSNCFICHSCKALVPKSPNFVRRKSWDGMIAHPDCRLFANAGLHYLKTRSDRINEQEQQFQFLLSLWNSPIPHIAIENPVGWLNTHWQPCSQIIQPFHFGDNERKTTCLWLKQLPPLFATCVYPDVKPTGHCIRRSGAQKGKIYNYYFRQGKNATDRARTFQGIANAMATQWSPILFERLK